MGSEMCIRDRAMLSDIATAIAKEAIEIFSQLESVQGGLAEVRHLQEAG